MALDTNLPNLLDVQRTVDPNGMLHAIAEVLTLTNSVLADSTSVEANARTFHETVLRSKQPTGTFRRFNQGVEAELSKTQVYTDRVASLESYCKADRDLVNSQPNPSGYLAQERQTFIEGLGQTAASKFFYGDVNSAPDEFHGLANRYNSAVTGLYQDYVSIHTAATSALTSIYFVTWDPRCTFLTYARGADNMGIGVEDKGVLTVQDDGAGGTNPAMFEAYLTHFKLSIGLSIADYRFNFRIANMNTAALVAADILTAMIEAKNTLQHLMWGRTMIYMNRTVKSVLDNYAATAPNVNLTPGTWGGEPVTMFQGIPIRIADAITNSETEVDP